MAGVSQAYHYMSIRGWQKLGAQVAGEINPGQRLIKEGPDDLPQWASDGFIFAFPDNPCPIQTGQPHFKRE